MYEEFPRFREQRTTKERSASRAFARVYALSCMCVCVRRKGKPAVIWRYGNKSAGRASEARQAMNSVYDAYFPGYARILYYCRCTWRLQGSVHARVRTRRRDLRDRDGKKDSRGGCVFSRVRNGDGILPSRDISPVTPSYAYRRIGDSIEEREKRPRSNDARDREIKSPQRRVPVIAKIRRETLLPLRIRPESI